MFPNKKCTRYIFGNVSMSRHATGADVYDGVQSQNRSPVYFSASTAPIFTLIITGQMNCVIQSKVSCIS